MKYLKISKNQFIEGKNTLKERKVAEPIYPFVNLNKVSTYCNLNCFLYCCGQGSSSTLPVPYMYNYINTLPTQDDTNHYTELNEILQKFNYITDSASFSGYSFLCGCSSNYTYDELFHTNFLNDFTAVNGYRGLYNTFNISFFGYESLYVFIKIIDKSNSDELFNNLKEAIRGSDGNHGNRWFKVQKILYNTKYLNKKKYIGHNRWAGYDSSENTRFLCIEFNININDMFNENIIKLSTSWMFGKANSNFYISNIYMFGKRSNNVSNMNKLFYDKKVNLTQNEFDNIKTVLTNNNFIAGGAQYVLRQQLKRKIFQIRVNLNTDYITNKEYALDGRFLDSHKILSPDIIFLENSDGQLSSSYLCKNIINNPTFPNSSKIVVRHHMNDEHEYPISMSAIGQNINEYSDGLAELYFQYYKENMINANNINYILNQLSLAKNESKIININFYDFSKLVLWNRPSWNEYKRFSSGAIDVFDYRTTIEEKQLNIYNICCTKLFNRIFSETQFTSINLFCNYTNWDIYISRNAFSHAKILKSITFNNLKIREIGSNAFYNCRSLNNIYLPSSYNILLHGGLFRGCTNLNNIYLDYAPYFIAGLHKNNPGFDYVQDLINTYNVSYTIALNAYKLLTCFYKTVRTSHVKQYEHKLINIIIKNKNDEFYNKFVQSVDLYNQIIIQDSSQKYSGYNCLLNVK